MSDLERKIKEAADKTMKRTIRKETVNAKLNDKDTRIEPF